MGNRTDSGNKCQTKRTGDIPLTSYDSLGDIELEMALHSSLLLKDTWRCYSVYQRASYPSFDIKSWHLPLIVLISCAYDATLPAWTTEKVLMTYSTDCSKSVMKTFFANDGPWILPSCGSRNAIVSGTTNPPTCTNSKSAGRPLLIRFNREK